MSIQIPHSMTVYDLYSIEYMFGPLKYFPVFHRTMTPWNSALNWWTALNELASGHATSTGCPRKFVPRLPKDCDKAAKGPHHTFT